MRVLLSEIQREWGLRMWHAIVFTAVFFIVGYYAPKIWYKWIDRTEYVKVDIVSFDKKVYKPCEIATSITHYYSRIDTEVRFRYRINRVVDNKIVTVPNSEQEIKTFIKQTGVKGVSVVGHPPVPCNFEPGVYFSEGIVIYYIRGEPRTAPYRTATVSIE